jgi:hypothetical protein
MPIKRRRMTFGHDKTFAAVSAQAPTMIQFFLLDGASLPVPDDALASRIRLSMTLLAHSNVAVWAD